MGMGGMERVMSLLIQCFVKLQYEVHLILIGRRREIWQLVPPEVEIHKPAWQFNNRLRNISTVKTSYFIRKTVQQIAPDVVLSFGEYWNNLVLLSLKGSNYPVYISDRSTPGKNLGILHNWLRALLYKNAAGYIAQTVQAAEVASQKHWNSNIRVIGNPIPQLEVSSHKTKTVLTVGRLIRTKNVDRLIDMFGRISPKLLEEWRLVIVGGDAKKQEISRELKALIQLKKLNNLVFLEGPQKNIQQYLDQSSIFAFASTSEGFPNALAEAMSAGLAVIAYDCIAGPSDLIDDGINGYLIPEHDEAKFIKKLQYLMEHEETRKRLGIAALEKVKRFDVNEVADQYLNFLFPD